MSSIKLHVVGSLLNKPQMLTQQPTQGSQFGGSYSTISDITKDNKKSAKINKRKMNDIEPSTLKEKLKVFIDFDFIK